MWFPMCRLRVSPYPETAGGGPSEKRDGTSPVLSQLLPHTCPWPQPLKTLFSCNGQPLGQIQAFEELTPMATLAMEEECGKQEWQLLRQLGLLAGHCPCLDCPPLSFLNIPTWSNPVKHILIFTLVREQQISVHWKPYSTLAKRKHPVILFHPPTSHPLFAPTVVSVASLLLPLFHSSLLVYLWIGNRQRQANRHSPVSGASFLCINTVFNTYLMLYS